MRVGRRPSLRPANRQTDGPRGGGRGSGGRTACIQAGCYLDEQDCFDFDYYKDCDYYSQLSAKPKASTGTDWWAERRGGVNSSGLRGCMYERTVT